MATVTPFLMFQGGLAQAALDLYGSVFPDFAMLQVDRYAEGEQGPAGTIKVARFTICGREFMCSDSPISHDFTFTPSSSLFVQCDTSEQLDRVFEALAEGGQVLMPRDNYGFSSRFGWVNDRFGVSWQLNLVA